MSYKKNRRDSHLVSDKQQFARAVAPFFCGFMIAMIIWVGWLLAYVENAENIDTNFIFLLMVIIIIIVEFPIVFIKIYLAYKNKIVKMRPESSYDIGNLDDYIKEVTKYRSGNYKYETINDELDIIDSHARGKMIIFTAFQETARETQP